MQQTNTSKTATQTNKKIKKKSTNKTEKLNTCTAAAKYEPKKEQVRVAFAL
jgi:hypothetical protein